MTAKGERDTRETSDPANEQRYRGLIDGSPDGILVVVGGRVVFANPAFAHLVRANVVGQVVGQSLMNFFDRLSHEDIENHIERGRAGKRVSSRLGVRGRRLDGTALEMEIAAAAVEWGGQDALQVIAHDITDRRQTEGMLTLAGAGLATHVEERTKELASANQALRASISRRERFEAERNQLLRQLSVAQEEERRRLSRELHDEAGQHLTALGLGLQALSDVTLPGSEADRRARELWKLSTILGQELHAIAVRLRPKVLDDFGLEAALANYVDEWTRQTGISIDIHAHVDAERLSAAVESGVYRMMQEALTNVARHSGATRASIVLRRVDGYLHAIIEDNGSGFDVMSVRGALNGAGGLGLLGMKERAALLAGEVEVESGPTGTTVFVRIPIVLPTEPSL